MTDVLKEIIRKTIEKVNFNDGQLVEEEYMQVEKVPPAPGRPGDQHDVMVSQGLCLKACQFPKHNRYCNLFPFDKNIVELKQDPKLTYINASWMTLPHWLEASRRFIVTMAPMHPESYANYGLKSDFEEDSTPNTCPNFWQMIWENQAKIIVMLCQISPGFTGCSKYFPLEEQEMMEQGDFRIKNVKTIKEEFIIERHFEVSKVPSEEKLSVGHFQFSQWPNYGVPSSVGPIADFIKKVHLVAREEEVKSKEPELVIHCSGGIGRSGTFLTAYGLYSHFLHQASSQASTSNQAIDLTQTVKSLRNQRHPWMVEGLHQYRMAYAIILHLLNTI